MPDGLRVLFLAAEAEPFIKVGGLGDVAGSLPRFLQHQSADINGGAQADIRLVIPLHSVVRADRHDLRPFRLFSLDSEVGPVAVRAFQAHSDGMPVYLLDAEPIARGGSVYSSDSVQDGSKYAFFSLAALELMRHMDWRADVVHANDWHTALANFAILLRRRKGEYKGLRSVLTVHNLPFMGPDIGGLLPGYGLAGAETGLPSWAAARPLPLGLWAADSIVAVSPSYAEEIQTPASGCGLDPYLRARRESLHGILNGIDVDSYNPAIDPVLTSNFGIPTLNLRAPNKAALQERMVLPVVADIPLMGVVSRLDPQKGIDLLGPALRRLKDERWQLVVLGTGAARLERSLRQLEKEFPGRVSTEIAYDGALARMIYGGADMLLMPSRYEPCGLAQMMAMRYGCLPIVSAVGGLKDTVIHEDTGFVLGKPTAARLAQGIAGAIRLFENKAEWAAMQRRAMSKDFSWNAAARRYLDLYRGLVDRPSQTPT